MSDFIKIRSLFAVCSLFVMCSSCGPQFKKDNFKAYFGGEVQNPVGRYVLFCKGNEVIDSIELRKDNTFFKAFDSLTPGLYSFRHDPEYQYVYFDKNDSLMVHINTRDFDNSIVFCGRGDQKNNFLMDIFLKNEADLSQIYPVFDYDVPQFIKTINARHDVLEQHYTKQKEEIQWSDGFDVYARAAIDFFHFSKKEMYPMAHRMRTGNDIKEKLPNDFYAYRNGIDYNNKELVDYAPFVAYLSHMLNNITDSNLKDHSITEVSLRSNIRKMEIADSLFNNAEVKNTILNNIAFTYLLEDQNMTNNKAFLQTFQKLSTDTSRTNEITRIANAISMLEPGKPLPAIKLVDVNGKITSSDALDKKKTVIFCWTDRLNSHFIAAHKKVMDFAATHPEFQFVSINLDSDQKKWTDNLARYNFPGIIEFRGHDFEDIKNKWAITKIHRTIILNEDGTINNAFTNLFDVNFEKNLSSTDHSAEITSR